MVSVTDPSARPAAETVLDLLATDLPDADRGNIARALEFAQPLYEGQTLSTGEAVWPHALGLATSLVKLGMDPAVRAAGVLFAAPKYLADANRLRETFGAEIARLAQGVEKLYQLRMQTRGGALDDKRDADEQTRQSEVLRKMVLAMAEDIRVVIIRLASRAQTLRYLTKNASDTRMAFARESLDIYAPLANRLGMWQLKWEIEDLALRFLDGDEYKRIAQMLDEKRGEREAFIQRVIDILGHECQTAEITAQIDGRPKHIYSIWKKMRNKGLDFDQIHDVRAVRVIVESIKDCYSVLGLVHHLWTPIPKEFDDYISRPKANMYRSLHTAVIGPDGRALEVQIRTQEMHEHAELGVAAHWRYKETDVAIAKAGGARAEGVFDEKIAWLRQLLAWRDEIADTNEWVEQFKHASLDDTVYVFTPQGKVLDLPAGATAIDFAYALHTDLGHRCRGARVDGQMVPLDKPLVNGQRVEIMSAKTGGPSRDWLNAERGYIKSSRARHKVRQWFNTLALSETIAAGRAVVEREMAREGEGKASLEALATQLEFHKPDDLFAAVGRDEINTRQLQIAIRTLVHGESHDTAQQTARLTPVPRSSTSQGDRGILIVGLDRLLTQLAKCCKPVPPDPIRGFVTRGRGVTIHRADCASLTHLAQTQAERMIEADWGARTEGTFEVEMVVLANDRQGLLRDISEALARERINVTAVNTQSRQDQANMRFTFQVADLAQLRRALSVVKEVNGVVSARRV